MTDAGKDEKEVLTEKAHTADTVPPPPGGDVYSAPTAVRDAPPDLLDAIRHAKAKAAKTAAPEPHLPPPPALPRAAIPEVLEVSAQLEPTEMPDEPTNVLPSKISGPPYVPPHARQMSDPSTQNVERRSRVGKGLMAVGIAVVFGCAAGLFLWLRAH